MKENRFLSAQIKLLQIVTDYLNTRMNKQWDSDTVNLKFERNFIDNVSDLIEDAKNVDGIISRETQLDMLPSSVVPDTDAELQRIRKETAEAEGLPMVNTDTL